MQANILITEEGHARLGDFGIIRIITDPTLVERDSVTSSTPGASRYMAPELLDPHQFRFKHTNPSKESDVHSFAMTAYEVFCSHHVARIVDRRLLPPDKVISGELPYSGVRGESHIAFEIASGHRPSRPTGETADLWLHDPIWEVIVRCWDHNPRFRLSARLLHRKFAEPQLEHEDTPLIHHEGES